MSKVDTAPGPTSMRCPVAITAAAPTGLTPRRSNTGYMVTIIRRARLNGLGTQIDNPILRRNIRASTIYGRFRRYKGRINVCANLVPAPICSIYFA